MTSNSSSPVRAIEELAANKLRAFAGTIDLATGRYLDDVYAQNKSLSEHVTADYHGRFLIELIQNGNDAHPRERRDGEIEVLLVEDEGPHGTLYVANRGNPFGYDNMEALARIGMSSKPPGEAIGNKGLGFRSVSHVCDEPEIYSQRDAPIMRGRFEGYCFTFAKRERLADYIADDRILELARGDLPAFFLPIPLEHQGELIRSFADRGFASVVRLPLRDSSAHQAAIGEVESLADDRAPLLLFLERLSALNANVEAAGIRRSSLRLTRQEQTILNAPICAARVLMDNGAWLILKDTVDETLMASAIAEGVTAKQLHGSWSEWSGSGEVALAVRLDAELKEPRLYTYLPMGEGAASPCNGHLHGSFFPTSNRKALDSSVALNSMLLGRAACLAAKGVHWLASSKVTTELEWMSEDMQAGAVVDLLAWHNPPSLLAEKNSSGISDLAETVADQLAKASGKPFVDTPAVPIAAHTNGNLELGWAAPSTIRGGFDASPTFNTIAVAEQGAAIEISILWPTIGPDRHGRICDYLRSNAPGAFLDHMTSAERASIAGGIAATLPAGRRPALARWSEFYRELPAFMDGIAGALVGQKILLCDDGSVRAGGQEGRGDGERLTGIRRRRTRGEQVEPSLFFPPVSRQSTDSDGPPPDEISVPSQLAEYFAFAANSLAWHGELRVAREFLERGIVSAYDGETVLTRVSQVVNSGVTIEQSIAGLRWAFAIWRRANEVGRPLKIDTNYRLLVPTAEQKLLPATEAIFSESWPEALLGKRLHAFLSAAPAELSELVQLRSRKLASTKHRAFKNVRISDWAEFLQNLGVGRGLQAIRLPVPSPSRAHQFRSFVFAETVGLSQVAIDDWQADINAHEKDALRLAYSTNYKFVGPLWALPGQSNYRDFSAHCREIYATLLIEWLATAPLKTFKVRLVHEHFNGHSHEWSTPAAAFLRSGEWLPADDPSPLGLARNNYRPTDVWIAELGNERFPHYLRQLAVSVNRVIERRPEALQALQGQFGLRVLNRPETLVEQAIFLAEQFAGGAVSPYYQPQLANLYSQTWRAILDPKAPGPPLVSNIDPGMPLITRRNGQLEVVVPGTSGTPDVYVRDSEDQLVASFVSSLQSALFEIKGADPRRVGEATSAIYGKRVKLLSAVRYDVKIDGCTLDNVTSAAPAVDVCPWLRPMLAIAMESLRGPDAAQLPLDRLSLFVRLQNVGLIPANSVTFEIEGQPIVGLGERSSYMFKGADDRPVVIVPGETRFTWSVIDRCLSSVCDAIELSSVATGMRLLARELEAIGEELADMVLDDVVLSRLLRVLDLDDSAAPAIRSLIGDQLATRLPWLRAAFHYYGGDDAWAEFKELELAHPDDAEGLVVALRPLAARIGLRVDHLLDASKRSLSAEQFRELLDVDLARFNHSLLATGSSAITFPDLQKAQLLNHIVDHEIELIEALRNRVADKLERLETAPEYKRFRDGLRAIAPDPAWLAIYEFVPDELLALHVGSWLESIGAPPIGQNPKGLPPLDVVRTTNNSIIAKLASASAPLVRAWWRNPLHALPEYWRDGSTAEQKIRSEIDNAGALDFKVFDQETLFAWCVQLDLWPDGMPQSLDREILGLAEGEVDAAEKAARLEAAERAAKARSVRFNGRDVDPEQADWTEISAEVAANLSRGLKNTRLNSLSALAAVQRHEKRRPGERKPKSSDPVDRVPQAKKDMIGRLGELVVYHWLSARYHLQDIDKAWVSKNGSAQNGKAGSDELGFDFELEHDRRTWWIEVKASQGDSCRFEMGESEVRAAREAAKPRSGKRYVVIYVANPADPATTQIDVLPNPMSEEADGVLDLLGEGVRYGFRRSIQ